MGLFSENIDIIVKFVIVLKDLKNMSCRRWYNILHTVFKYSVLLSLILHVKTNERTFCYYEGKMVVFTAVNKTFDLRTRIDEKYTFEIAFELFRYAYNHFESKINRIMTLESIDIVYINGKIKDSKT